MTEHNNAADYPLGTVLRDPKAGRLAVRFRQDDSTGKGMHAWYIPAPDPTEARVLHHVEVYGWDLVVLPPGVAGVVRAVLERQAGELDAALGGEARARRECNELYEEVSLLKRELATAQQAYSRTFDRMATIENEELGR